jgi:membrane protease subunit HflK
MASPNTISFPDPEKLKFSLGRFAAGVLAVAVVIGLFSTFYQVPAESVAVVQRFGAYVKTVDPGLQLKLPFGIDQKTNVAVQRQLKLEFGYGTEGGTNRHQSSFNRYDMEAEKNMVTGDLNAAVVEWVVQFHIVDAKAYVFHFREPGKTLRDLSEAVMREAVGDRTIDEVLTFGRQEIEVVALERLQELVASLQMGVQIDQIQLGNVNPPPPVQASFDEVNKAQQERESLINQANAEYNKAIPRAKGEAEQMISTAEGYATKRVNEAEGDAARFNALLAEYEKAPEVTRQRIYLETMSTVLPSLGGKVVLDDEASQFLPLMQLQPGNRQGGSGQ